MNLPPQDYFLIESSNFIITIFLMYVKNFNVVEHKV